MKFTHLLSLLAVLLVFKAPAVAQGDICESTEYLQHQMSLHPEMAERMQQIEDFTQKWIADHPDGFAFESSTPVVTIPVVIHVVYKNATEDLSDAQILSQIDVLNEDYRRLNSDTANTLAVYKPLAADFEIEFCMASSDPSGNPTTGIDRVATTNSSFSPLTDNVKSASSGGADPWPSDQYLNIWVCDIGSILGGDVLGYATFPGGPPALDGVVVDYIAFGRQLGTATPPYDLGRSTTHEVGHWLNLRHTWGNCSFLFCCSFDDLVGDTPNCFGPNYGCPLTATSCGSQDMVQNYMDYADDNCSNLFTQGQKDRAMALFAAGGARESLLTSTGCSGGTPNCDVPVNLNVNILSGTSATLSWDPVGSALSYNIEGRRSGMGGGASASVATNSFTYNNFQAGDSYDWRVSADCGALGTSSFSAIGTFTMPVFREESPLPILQLYPNPAKNEVVLNMVDLDSEFMQVEVFDALGRRVWFASQLPTQSNITLHIENWNVGMYLVHVRSQNINQSEFLQVY